MSVNFRVALTEEYRKWKASEMIPPPFVFYSGVSERIGSDHCARKKAELFFQLDKELQIIKMFLLLSASGAVRYLKQKYFSVSGAISVQSYEDLLGILAHAADPDCFESVAYHGAPSVASVMKRERPPLADEPEECAAAPAPPVSYDETPVSADTLFPHQEEASSAEEMPSTDIVQPMPSPAEAEAEKGRDAVSVASSAAHQKSLSVLAGILLFVLTGTAFALMARNLTDEMWRWFLGGVCGIVAVVLPLMIACLIDRFFHRSVKVALQFAFPVPTIANIVLAIQLGASYTIIFICVSIAVTAAHAVCVRLSSAAPGKRCRKIHTAEGIITALIAALHLLIR